MDPNSQYNRFISVLRSIVDLDSSTDLSNALNFPDRCLDGFVFAEAKNAYCDQYGQDCSYTSMEWIDKLYLSDVEFENCEVFRERYALISQLHMATAWKPTQVVAAYVSYLLKNRYDVSCPDDFHFVLQVLDIAKNYEESFGEKTIRVFLEHLLLTINTDEAANSISLDAVNLLTMHRAKGLEFKVVFLVGIQAGIIPNDRYIRTQSELEQERRLFYVAITRAKDLLFITSYADPFGVNPSAPYVKHGFMAEIPEVAYSKTIPEKLAPAKDKDDFISISLSTDTALVVQQRPAIQVAAQTIQETIESIEPDTFPKIEAEEVAASISADESIQTAEICAPYEQSETAQESVLETAEEGIESCDLSDLNEDQLKRFIEYSDLEEALALASNITIPTDKYVVIIGYTKLSLDKVKGMMNRHGLLMKRPWRYQRAKRKYGRLQGD